MRVDATLQSGQKSVIGAPMESPKKPWFCEIVVLFARKLLETLEERVDDDYIGIQTIDSRRKNEVEAEAMDPAIPRAGN
jgi:hypothetical protein